MLRHFDSLLMPPSNYLLPGLHLRRLWQKMLTPREAPDRQLMSIITSLASVFKPDLPDDITALQKGVSALLQWRRDLSGTAESLPPSCCILTAMLPLPPLPLPLRPPPPPMMNVHRCHVDVSQRARTQTSVYHDKHPRCVIQFSSTLNLNCDKEAKLENLLISLCNVPFSDLIAFK